MLIGNSNLNHRNQSSIKFFAENNIRFGIYSNANASNIDINCIDFTNRYHGIIAGSNMSTGGGYAMLVDDESGYFSTRFWYDRLGRLVLSQNTKQFNLTPQRYSYTRYDNLGRIFEVGEKKENTSGSQWLFPDIFGSTINGMPNKRTIDQAKLNSWLDLNATSTRIQVTSTYYSDPISGMTFVQDHLRNRVAAVTYEDQFDGDPETYASATHYSYDIHGNVKSLYQQNNDILATGQQIKRIDYEYDLISGNVNKVIYQPNQTDQFIHSYQYDADNRLKEVLTSKDGYVWDSDARYFYYAHGPLARVELGDLNVQGLDYAYTLQGWIKGVNSNLLNPQHDMGLDGYDQAGNPNSLFGWDAMGYTLGYFDGDYSSIGPATSGGNIVTPEFEASLGTSNLHTSRRNLYNGNISHWVTTLPQVTGGAVTPITNTTSSFPVDPLGMAFEYDQLNRLLESEGYDNINTATNSWNSTSGYSPLYKNTFTYDANGNIMTQKRFDRTSATPFDSLTYHYEEDLGHKVNNKLRRVTDIAGSVSGIDDIEDQSNPDNYLYDEIGNLITDDQEGIATIEWTVSGKVSKITREAGSTAPDLEFHYDPMGNRITKIVKPAGQLANPDQWLYTYYTRDAQGNPMAVYSEFSELDPSTQLPVMRFDLTERYIYGSTRIATDTNIVHMEQAAPTGTYHFRRKLGTKHFELTNHLGNVLAVVTDKKIPVDLGTPDGITDGYLPDIASVSDYYPFGMLIPGRNSEGYRFGFNGKEQVNEACGNGNIYDYGFRIYNPRIGKFLSIDPLTASYPWYTPYQFAGNKPIVAVDLDGLEERIVIYNSLSDGRIKTTTIDYNTLTESVQISGGYTLSKSISREQFLAYKATYFKGFADLKNNFGSGYQQYTLGMSAHNTSGFIGPGKGTLTIGAGTNGTTFQYDPTPLQEKQESSASILKRNLQNPDMQTKAAMSTMKKYVAGVSLAVSIPLLLSTAPSFAMIPEYIGAASNADQLTGGKLTTTGNPQTDQAINFVKVSLNVWSLKSSFNNIDNATEAVPLIITGGTGTALDVCDMIIPPTQDNQ